MGLVCLDVQLSSLMERARPRLKRNIVRLRRARQHGGRAHTIHRSRIVVDRIDARGRPDAFLAGRWTQSDVAVGIARRRTRRRSRATLAAASSLSLSLSPLTLLTALPGLTGLR